MYTTVSLTQMRSVTITRVNEAVNIAVINLKWLEYREFFIFILTMSFDHLL